MRLLAHGVMLFAAMPMACLNSDEVLRMKILPRIS